MNTGSTQTQAVTVSKSGVNGLAVAAFITGIVSLLFCWGGWLFVVSAAAAVFTGVKGSRVAQVKGQNGLAIAGLVLGLLAAIFEFVILCSIGHP